MNTTCHYHRHRFTLDVISQYIWLYFRFCLSYRDVKEMMAERGVTVSYETFCAWCCKFGQEYARHLRRQRSGARIVDKYKETEKTSSEKAATTQA